MKVLVTGSTGLVGTEAVDFFTEKGWEVIGVDNNSRRRFFGTPSKLAPFHVDITSWAQVDELFETNKFDVIIHAAAQPSHDYSVGHPAEDFYTNALGTLVLLESTRIHCPNATFIFVSTDKVYGGNMYRPQLIEMEKRWYHDKPFDESLSIDQTVHSPFGVSKVAADLMVQEYGFQYHLNTACFRCGCITGRNHEGAEQHGFLAYLAKCVREKKLYKIFGFRGKQVRDQIHAYDLVNAFWHFIHRPHIAQVYNMGGGPERSVSVLEAIELIEKETGKKAITE